MLINRLLSQRFYNLVIYDEIENKILNLLNISSYWIKISYFVEMKLFIFSSFVYLGMEFDGTVFLFQIFTTPKEMENIGATERNWPHSWQIGCEQKIPTDKAPPR